MDWRARRAPFAVLLWLAACGGGGPEVPDPCAAVGVCTTPPADACAPASASVALRYPGAGTCSVVAGVASCDYQPTLVDCALTGQVCQAGGCVAPPDPCAAPDACSAPPAAACASATLLLRYVDPAQCTAQGGLAVCSYPPSEVDCAAASQVCQDGACVAPPDPCAEPGACTAPPSASCESATVRTTFGLPATCTAQGGQAVCEYPVAQRDDCGAAGQVCQGGACVAPPQCLVAGDCASPPPDGCLSATRAQRHPNPGTCGEVGGAAACLYPPSEVDCGASDLACAAGACVDPCGAPEACAALPADDCASLTVRLDYDPAGVTCLHPGGVAQCSYAPAVVDCGASDLACRGGACVDPCGLPAACPPPPPDACASARTLLHYPTTSCTSPGGQVACDYPPVQVTCPAGEVCAAGACVTDPCAMPTDGAGYLAYAAWMDGINGYDLRAIRLDGTCDQPLAGGPGDDLEPSWRGAAGRLAWGAVRLGLGRVAVMDLSDRLEQLLDTGSDIHLASSPALSADGSLVIFERRVLASSSADLYFQRIATGATGPVYANASRNEAGPAFSTDGASLYFVADYSGLVSIWRGPWYGPTPESPAVAIADDLIGRPALSADGKYLAYAVASATPGSISRVVLLHLGTLEQRVLSDDGDSEPAFPAAGVLVDGHEVLAVRTTRHGFTDVVLLDLATGAEVRRLTDGSRLVGTPAFPR